MEAKNSNSTANRQNSCRKLLPLNEAKVNFADDNWSKTNNTGNNNNNESSVNDNNNSNYQFRNTFLTEVTFSDLNNYHDHMDPIEDNERMARLNVEGHEDQLKQSVSDIDEDSILSTSTSTTAINKKKPNIPDGGYGWVVVFASFTVSMIVDGIAFSFGLILTKLFERFKCEPAYKISLVGSLFLAVPLLSGPVLSNLVDKYGCKRMTFIGGLIAALGFSLTYFSKSVEMLYLTFGLISGIGIGISYVTAVVSVAFWFDKRRTFAIGLSASGTGLGTFFYAPLTNWLVEQYDWEGATLILGGTLLNVCVCGCLMRNPDWLTEENRLDSQSQSMLTVSNSSVFLGDIKKMLETGAPGETVLDTLVTNVNTEANQQIQDLGDIYITRKYHSEQHLPTYFYLNDLDFDIDFHPGSRRSLRHKDSESISRDNIFSTSTLKSPLQKSEEHIPMECHLASAETLNASEKVPSDESFAAYTSDLYPLGNENRYGSRLSLDETLFKRWRDNKKQLTHNLRGNSLGTLLENDNDKAQNQEIRINVPLLDKVNGKNQNKIVSKPHHRHHHKQHHHKQHHHLRAQITGEIVSNLRGYVALKNAHYFRNMRMHRNSIHYRSAMMNTHRYRMKASSCPNIYRNSMTTLAKEEEEKWYDNFVDLIKSMFDLSLFLDMKFACFNLSTLLLYISFIVPYYNITDHMKDHIPSHLKNSDEDLRTERKAAAFLSCIGIFNTIGMIVLGYIGDKPWLHIAKTYSVCLVICGLSTALMPLAVDHYEILLVLGAIFGLTFASSFPFTPIILVRLVELDELTCAYGLVLLVQGVGNLLGPPLSGALYELTSTWDLSFYLAGAFIALSGVLAWITGYLEDREDDDDEDEPESTPKTVKNTSEDLNNCSK